MISVLSAVAEIERENILVQTMEGRKQKAREGKWNGGFAPYGYKLVNGELQIAEDEAEVIRLIYDKFIHTNMGMSAIASWLNQHGYKRKRDRIIRWMLLQLHSSKVFWIIRSTVESWHLAAERMRKFPEQEMNIGL